ncbi:MAG TPA: DUF4097 family beta strand repeat-containing protein [Longimicrobiales bacterium]|nr:DUF4097 family beta strand repeat-containing protein [Longimicrobiales bacterium]
MVGFGRVVAAVMGMTALATAPLAAQDQYAVSGAHVAIFNLAGEVEVTGTNGGSVAVEVLRGGPDGDALTVDIGEVDNRQTLRVRYPSDRVVYERLAGGTTSLRVRDDGTWGGDSGSSFFGGGDRVRVSGRGSGVRAHADLRIAVPSGQRVDIYLAAGRITASNVDGEVLLDTHSGGVSAANMRGSLRIDTGSGSVEVAGVDGDLDVDTGSGSVVASDVRAGAVLIDTGSGGVTADAIEAQRIRMDTGSGGIRLRSSSAREVELDTGSGSILAELTGQIDQLLADTGSGGVTLRLPPSLSARLDVDTGSGGIEVDFPMEVTTRTRGALRGRIGDGLASITVDTGSGSVRIQRL